MLRTSTSAHTDAFAADDESPLIPVRMLNEYTYCPRLGYLEWVQGEWAENLETAEGTFGHRNVDKSHHREVKAASSSAADSNDEPTETANEDSAPETIHTRSLTLGSEKLGLIAKLDIIEIQGNAATPVDYKRGKVPDTQYQAYDPERVQLCAQGLLLQEQGYRCEGGVLYFIAAKKRVVIPFDEELIELTLRQIEAFRETALRGRIPPPLIDSPKCPRCSLVGICLPDETNYLAQLQIDPTESPVDADENQTTDEAASSTPSKDGLRRLLPARDHALPFYVQHQGAFVGKSGDRLNVTYKKDKLSSVRLIDVSQVAVFGSVMFSAQALKELVVRGIPVCHFSYGGWFYGVTSGLMHNNIELRREQFRVAESATESLAIARRLIAGKIKNCRTLLRRHMKNRDDLLLRKLNDYANKALQADSAATLLGLEGMAAKEYFANFFPLIAGGECTQVRHRNRRPPKDPINAVLSFVYSLLTKELTIVCQAVGFDPLLGMFHRPRFGRPSLALDLAEEFRPLIADSVVLMAFNNREVTDTCFIERAGACAMTDKGRKNLLSAFERRMNSEITHPLFGYKITYRRILEVQTRLLARHLLGELPDYPNFCTR